MSEAQRHARHQQQVQELCAAAARAVSGVPDLHWSGHRLHRGRKPLASFAPHLQPQTDSGDGAGFAAWRGATDAQALRLRLCDATLHARLRPADPVEQVVFELLEQFRVEAMAPQHLPGVRRNLQACFDAWSAAFQQAGLTDTASGILLFTVAQVCRARVTGGQPDEATLDLMEATRAGIAALIGVPLQGLRSERADQAAYAQHALHIARSIAALLRAALQEAGRSEAGGDSADPAAFALQMMNMVGEPTERFATAPSGRSRVRDAADDGYRVFTRTYDREFSAASLVRPELRAEYRQRLDQRIAQSGANLSRLVRDLRQMLARPTSQGWDGGEEEGLIDGRRLAQLVATPRERRLFQLERLQPVVDCVVCFLVDCSGSMKQHVEALAVLLDVFSHGLELAGATSEILGFTTGAWNGGRAQRDWLRAGRPPNPGRLNELCHMVFKDADTGWRRARHGIAALLKADLFRESVDGEAVQWAVHRLQARPEPRKLLIVVSDGSPMDSATHLANDPHYLDQHLRDVVQQVEVQQQIEIAGLGVGLDLSPYYGRSQVLDLDGDSVNRQLRGIARLVRESSRR